MLLKIRLHCCIGVYADFNSQAPPPSIRRFTANNTGLQQQLKTIEDFLAEQQEAVTEYEEALVRKLISKITVFDDKLVVEFKSGLETEVKM